jgi:hypothetical protein
MPPTVFGRGPLVLMLLAADAEGTQNELSDTWVHWPALQVKHWPHTVPAQPQLASLSGVHVPLQQTPPGQSESWQQPWQIPEQHTPAPQLVPSEAGVPTHTPSWQVSFVVHGSPLSHEFPVRGACTQFPVDVSHAAEWHWSDGVQTTGLLPVQTPDWQV